jgi:glycosyltransferase involved in cell wall biosynthesis
VPAMSEAMMRLHDDPEACRRLSEAGVARARGFTWDRAARVALGVLAQAAGRG